MAINEIEFSGSPGDAAYSQFTEFNVQRIRALSSISGVYKFDTYYASATGTIEDYAVFVRDCKADKPEALKLFGEFMLWRLTR